MSLKPCGYKIKENSLKFQDEEMKRVTRTHLHTIIIGDAYAFIKFLCKVLVLL